MTDQMLHTPDGVRDIYNGECKQKLLLQERLHDVLRQYGCRDIQTPTFEFFNIFGKEIGTTPSKDLYKFFDKDGSGTSSGFYSIYCKKCCKVLYRR